MSGSDREQVWIRRIVTKKNGSLAERWIRVKDAEAIKQLLGYTPDKIRDERRGTNVRIR